MSILNFLRPSYSPKEKQLLKLSIQMYIAMGFSPKKAESECRGLLDQCIEESKKEGLYCLPKNIGDIILGDAENDDQTIDTLVEKIRKDLPKKKAEGVRDEDIRWWWNLNDVERRMMIRTDEIFILGSFTDAIMQGLSGKEAGKKVRKYHPIYGDPEDTTHAKGDDRPLPYELKDRINIYIEKRVENDLEQFKKEIEESSTFNALIRKEIKAGRI